LEQIFNIVFLVNLKSKFALRRALSHKPTAKGGHGLPGVSPGPAIPYPSTPCGWTTPEIALYYIVIAVSGVAHPQGGQPAAVFYPFGHPTPYAHTSPSQDRQPANRTVATWSFLEHYCIETREGGPLAGRAVCSRPLPFWTPHAVRLCMLPLVQTHY
jgi:hypothetical protein